MFLFLDYFTSQKAVGGVLSLLLLHTMVEGTLIVKHVVEYHSQSTFLITLFIQEGGTFIPHLEGHSAQIVSGVREK